MDNVICVAPIVDFLYGTPTAAASRFGPRLGLFGFWSDWAYMRSSGRTRETQGMTDLQTGLLIAPFLLSAIGAAAGFW
jgi:hypothetical protein